MGTSTSPIGIPKRAWSTDEILRLIDSLQVTHKHGVATQADWKPGDPVIVEPPTTAEGAEERLKAGYEYKDWFLCYKKI